MLSDYFSLQTEQKDKQIKKFKTYFLWWNKLVDMGRVRV